MRVWPACARRVHRSEFSTKFCLEVEGTMPAKKDVRPITHLKTKTADLVREVSEEGRPITITQNGEAKVVVMDVETYDRWRAAMALLKALAQGEADVERGRTVKQAEAFRRAQRAIERTARDG